MSAFNTVPVVIPKFVDKLVDWKVGTGPWVVQLFLPFVPTFAVGYFVCPGLEIKN